MKFIYDYELCALVFLVIIMVFYFAKRRLGSMTNRMFSMFLIMSFFDIVFDVGATMLLDRGASVPRWMNCVANGTFYCLQVLVTYSAYLYVLAMTNKLSSIGKKRIIISSIPCAIHILISATSSFTGLYFTIGANNEFAYGPIHVMHYVFPVFYLILATFFAFYYRKSITETQLFAISVLGVLSVLCAVTQAMFPEYLIVGVAAVTAALFMLLSLQNPNDNIDSLTGNFNDLAFTQFCNRSFVDKESFTLIAININGLKALNNTFGVENCDKLIHEIGAFIQGVNERIVTFRIAGSTFGAVTYSEAVTEEFLQDINSRFSHHWSICDVEVRIHTSVVRVDVPKYARSIETLLYDVDYCMNMQKENDNIDTYICMDDKLYNEIRNSAELEEAILEAIKREDFSVVYQPIYSVKKHKFIAVEALARLNDNKLGEIYPEVFLPVAEKNGYLVKIGSVVLNKVCDFVSRNDMDKLGLEYVSVNLSAPECMQEDLASQIYSVFNNYIMDPKYIHFDISETAAANAIDHLRVSMYRILKSGCDFALDDYGTGYSNLSGIIELPFSMVKIDRSIIWNMENDTRTDAVMKNIIGMLQSVGMSVLAEGVEDADQLKFLKKFGVEYIQGYYFASAYDEDQLFERMRADEGRIANEF